ncbi:MAG: hypothetical protein K0R57_2659 [Paenibacillaceae bacterium]|jgi:spore germination protein KB|nr:hypothetical protein [Paenibacillaceae bacterium]
MKEKISGIQTVAIVYNTIVPTAILVVPNIVISHSRQDAWISILGALILALGFAVLTGAIVRNNPGMSFPVWISKRFGKIAGLVGGLLLAQYYISISAVILQEFINILSDQILLKTPNIVLMSLILIVSAYAVHSGIEVIARVNGVVTVITMLAYCISFFLFVNLIDFHLLAPVMNNSLSKISFGGLLPLGWMSESAIILVLMPYLKDTAKAGKYAVYGTVLAGLHLTITVVLCIAVFGPDLPQQFRYPSFSMIEVIRIGATLERIDILFVSFWLCTIYVKMSLFLFGAYHCLTETLQMKPSKPLLFALSMLVLLTTVTSFQSETSFDMQSQHVTPYELLTINLLLPAVIWIGLQLKKIPKLK